MKRNNNHTATLLSDGKIFITGGLSEGGIVSSEIYDPETGVSSSINNMLYPRYWHASTLLQNGKVLITGGASAPNSGYLKSAEVME